MTLEGIKPAIHQLLSVLDFLHSVAHIIYTGKKCLFHLDYPVNLIPNKDL